MNILVCISHVPDTTTKITFSGDGKELNTAGVQFIINPYDEIALTRALELTEKEGGEVTVIHVGPANTEATIRKALAIGAHKAVRVEATPLHGMAVAEELAAYAKDKNFDLILCGKESIDHNGGMVPVALAEMLDLPNVSFCKSLEINGKEAKAEREIEGGKETLSFALPAVVTAVEGLAEPRIPNMRGIMTARTKPLEVIQAQSQGKGPELKSFTTPQGRGKIKLFEAGQEEALVQALHTEAKVI